MKKRGDADGSVQYNGALKSRKAVISYIIALAVVLALCILLSHFMHVRDNNQMDALNQENLTALEKIQNLQDLNDTLTAENDALYKENESLKSDVTAMTAEKEKLDTELSEAEKARDELQKQYDELKKNYDELTNPAENEQPNQ